MRLADQADTDWKPLGITQVISHQPVGRDLVGDLLHIIRIAYLQTRFVIEEVDQSGLSAFDLGA